MAYEELQVPGEPGVWLCARHSNTQTRLRCGRCEKPICPKCTNMGPVGARCRDCLSNRDSHLYRASAPQLALAAVAAIGVGAAGAVLFGLLGSFWLWAIFLAPTLGPLLGNLVTRITRGKRGPLVAGVTGASLALGALATGALTGAIFSPFLWLLVVIAIIGVWLLLK